MTESRAEMGMIWRENGQIFRSHKGLDLFWSSEPDGQVLLSSSPALQCDPDALEGPLLT